MSLPVYYTIEGSPFTAATVALPPSPFLTPRGSPRRSSSGSPYGSPYGVRLMPLPPSPSDSRYAASYLPPFHHYSPPRNSLPAVPTLANLALGTEFTPHALLQFDPEDPKVIWDARLPPHTTRLPGNASRFHRLSSNLINQQALSPPWTFMRIKCDLLPWMVEISNPNGVTVRDVFERIWEFLRERIDREDWRDATDDFRGRLRNHCERRCRLIGEVEDAGRAARIREERVGVRRVDWLLGDFEWLGISKRDGEVETWEMHFRSR